MAKTQRRSGKSTPSLGKRLSKMSRAQAIFSILAIVVVLSLVIGTVGATIISDLQSGNSNNTSSNNNSTSANDPVLNQYRAEAQASPNDPATLAALANYLANTGNTDEAIIWYQKAVDLTPNNEDLRLDFGSALSKGEKYADAELQFKMVIAAIPNYAQAYLYLGELYLNWVPPRDADAIVALNKAISLDPTSVIAQKAREDMSRIVSATPGASPAATP